MRRRSLTYVALLGLLATAVCTDAPTVPKARRIEAPAPAITLGNYISAQIEELYPKGYESSIAARWATVLQKQLGGDMAGAVLHLNSLVDWIIKKEMVIAPPAGETQQQAAARLILNMARYLYEGAETSVAPVMSPDAAVEVIPAGSPGQVVVPSGNASLSFGPQAETRIIVITPEAPGDECSGPLPTSRCQYGPFYSFDSYPHTRLNAPGRFAICAVFGDQTPQTIRDRVRLAHDKPADATNYTPGGTIEGGIEILPRAAAPSGFTACPEYESVFFSEFTFVDPESQPDLALFDVEAPPQVAAPGARVWLSFLVGNLSVQSGGLATGPSEATRAVLFLTDATGGPVLAADSAPVMALPLNSTFGVELAVDMPATEGTFQLNFVVRPSPGAQGEVRLSNNEVSWIISTAPAAASRLVFATQPADVVAGDVMQPIVVELQDDQGQVVRESGTVHVFAYSGQFGITPRTIVGTTRVDAIDGRATFDDLRLTVAEDYRIRVQTVSGLAVEGHIRVSPRTGQPFIAFVENQNQTPVPGAPLPNAPIVLVSDVYGNSLGAGYQVMFTAGGGGTVFGANQITDASGRAAPNAWFMAPQPGVNTLTAATPGAIPAVLTLFPPAFNVASISAGYDMTCATTLVDNIPHCWGDNTYGQIGDGSFNMRTQPMPLAAGLLQLTQVSAGVRFSCGVATNGDGYCWGTNPFGQLGNGTTDDSRTPVLVAGGHHWQKIVAGGWHACGLDTQGLAWCWGAAVQGQLGIPYDGVMTDRLTPVSVVGLRQYADISVGSFHTCAVEASGTAWCWGQNEHGQVGDGSSDSWRYLPAQVAGGRAYSHIAAGGGHTCAISQGGVYCWGGNFFGALGTGAPNNTTERSPVPAQGIHGTAFQLAAGAAHSCAITIGLDAKVSTYCWGNNEHGQLGDGTSTSRSTGTLVIGDVELAKISAGQDHTCATQTSGRSFCWGWQYLGRLGDGKFQAISVTSPTSVLRP